MPQKSLSDIKKDIASHRSVLDRVHAARQAVRGYMELAPHVAIIPGLVISITILGFNLIGDGLRDIFDPRQYET